MEYLIKTIQSTPVPILLIITGLLFLLLGFVKNLGGLIVVSTEFKKWTIPVGLLILSIGLVLYFIPSPNPNSGSNFSETSLRSGEVRAIIDDPDGYTNIRSGQGIQYSIIARVVEGEYFYTIPQQDDWWPVRTKNNKLGYMNRSRIKVIN